MLFFPPISRGLFKPPGLPRFSNIMAPPMVRAVLPMADRAFTATGPTPSIHPITKGSAVVMAPTLWGQGAQFNDTALTSNVLTYRLNPPAKATVEVLFITGSALTNRTVCGFNGGPDGTDTTGDKTIYFDGSDDLTWYAYDGSGHTAVDTTTAFAASTLYHVVGTMEGTALRLYVNGALTASSSIGASQTSYAATSHFCLGSTIKGVDNTVRKSNVTVLFAAVSDTGWQSNQVFARYANVYSMLQYPEDNLLGQSLIGGHFQTPSPDFSSWRTK